MKTNKILTSKNAVFNYLRYYIFIICCAILFTANHLLGGKEFNLYDNSQQKPTRIQWPKRKFNKVLKISQCKTQEKLTKPTEHNSLRVTSSSPNLGFNKIFIAINLDGIKCMVQNHISAILSNDTQLIARSYKEIKNKITEIKKDHERKSFEYALTLMRQWMKRYGEEFNVNINEDKVYALICSEINKYNGINPVSPNKIISFLMENINETKDKFIENANICTIKYLIEQLIKQLDYPYIISTRRSKIYKALEALKMPLQFTELNYLIFTINKIINPPTDTH
jgi:hypothetical protein